MQNISKLLAGSLSVCAIAVPWQSAFAMAPLSQDLSSVDVSAEEILKLEDTELLANATPSVSELLSETQSTSFGQVTSVSQLSDVYPTDWAFQALQSLVERYGCIAGYPDGTFRGNRSATRYEMAAALNACLDNISDKFATKEDLEAVRALQEEFQAELATLRGRVDGLEARTATLEAQQFSTTTKLQGEVVMAGQFGDFVNNPTNTTAALGAGNIGGSRASVLSRVRLNFNTSFSGEDLLQTQLEVGNNGQDFFTANGFL